MFELAVNARVGVDAHEVDSLARIARFGDGFDEGVDLAERIF